MKTVLTSLIFFSLFASNTIHAQEDSTKIEEDVEVVISPKKGQDSTIVRVAGMKIIVLNDGQGKNEEIIIDTENLEEQIEKQKEKDNDPVHHWAGIRVGVNGFLENNGLPLLAGDQNLELDYGRSVSWDLNLFEKDIKIYKQYVEVVTGLGMHFANYSFNSNYATLQPTIPFSYSVDSTRILTKNRLKATYITAPLMLGFATHKEQDKAFRLAAGAQVSWRINSKLKQRYELNGNNISNKYKGDYDLNPFLFHAIASVGYGPMSVYAKYGLNPLFQSGRTAGSPTPFDVGLQLMF